MDRRTLPNAHGFVVVVVLLLRHTICVGDFAVDRVTKAKDRSAGGEVVEVVRIDHDAHVSSHPDFVQLDAIWCVGDLNHGCHWHAEAKAIGDAATGVWPDLVAVPGTHLGRSFQNLHRLAVAH